MQIAIIDDDMYFIEILMNEIITIYPQSKIDAFSNVEKEVYQTPYDIIFLDVMLAGEQSFSYGQEILDMSPKKTLVYISSIEHFVYDSYRQDSFFFIRKSNLHLDLIDFNHKYEKIKLNQNQILTLSNLHIQQQDILYIESQRNKSIIHTLYSTDTVYISLKKLIEKLENNSFYKLNSFTIINLNQIIKVEKKSILLSTGEVINFTRNSRQPFLQEYMRYRQAKIWNG